MDVLQMNKRLSTSAESDRIPILSCSHAELVMDVVNIFSKKWQKHKTVNAKSFQLSNSIHLSINADLNSSNQFFPLCRVVNFTFFLIRNSNLIMNISSKFWTSIILQDLFCQAQLSDINSFENLLSCQKKNLIECNLPLSVQIISYQEDQKPSFIQNKSLRSSKQKIVKEMITCFCSSLQQESGLENLRKNRILMNIRKYKKISLIRWLNFQFHTKFYL